MRIALHHLHPLTYFLDSEEVAEWMQELNGFNIPDITPTADGTCIGDPVAATNAASRGWWSCGGYTRVTDIVACPDKLTWGVRYSWILRCLVEF